MNQSLKKRMTSSCPVLKDVAPYLEDQEVHSSLVVAGVELVVTGLDHVVFPWFVNEAGAIAEVEITGVTATGFTVNSPVNCTIYYR